MARSTKRKRRLWDAYAFPGFRPLPTVRGVFGDPKARVITLRRRSKKRVVGRGSSTPGLVRPTRAMGPGPCLGRSAHLLGSGSATRALPALRQGEARTAGLPGRQSVLHQALCLLRGSALSLGDVKDIA